MTTTPSTSTDTSTGAQTPTDPDALRRDIDETRAHLADTVDALHHKLDVKAQAKRTAQDWRHQAEETAQRLQQQAQVQAQRLQQQAQVHAQRLQQQAQDLWQRQPQAVAGGAAAIVGFVVVLVVANHRR